MRAGVRYTVLGTLAESSHCQGLGEREGGIEDRERGE